MKNWFKEWFDSPYYEELYSDRDNDEADNFIAALVGYLEIPRGSKALDLACGNGRHALALYNCGMEVTGIDLSFKMILQAKEFEVEKLSFYQHDMRHLFCINYFDFVFNLFTSFGYFSSERENSFAAKNLILNLKKDGILVVDYFNKNYIINNLIKNEEQKFGENEYHIKRCINEDRVVKEITVCTPGECIPYYETVKIYTLKEMCSTFEPFGVKLVEVLGDYQLSKFDEIKSPRMICIFKKH
ncbi:MAG: class I SAM-dependent methyltransferase [Saprospiraceae bacterium]